MIKKLLTITLFSMVCAVSFSGSSLFAYSKTPGEHVDDTIDKIEYKYQDVKDECTEAKDRLTHDYHKAKEKADDKAKETKYELREQLK